MYEVSEASSGDDNWLVSDSELLEQSEEEEGEENGEEEQQEDEDEDDDEDEDEDEDDDDIFPKDQEKEKKRII